MRFGRGAPFGVVDAEALDLVRNDRALSAEWRDAVYADISSPAKAAICGYDDDNDTSALAVAALHRDRAIPWGFAVTTDWVGDAGKLTWAEIRSIRDYGMEILSHSVTHSNPATWEAYEAELADSAAAIRAENIYCDAFKEPGDFTGDSKIDTLADFDTRKMRLLRSVYSHEAGYYNADTKSSTRPKPVLRPYGGGTMFEATDSTLATMTGILDNCIVQNALMVVGMHSRYLDQPGKLTTADWTAFLDYVVTKRDAGLVDCLTPTGAYHAKRGARENLLLDPLFENSITGAFNGAWEVTGAPTVSMGGPDGLKYVEVPDTANHLSQKTRCDNLRTVLFRGRARSASGAGTARLNLRSADLVSGTTYVERNVTKAVTDSAWTWVEALITMDPRANMLRTWLYHTGSGGAIRWADLQLVKV